MFSKDQKNQKNLTPERRNELNTKSAEAVARYNARYNNSLYVAAIKGKTNRYANALIDDALALCGDPWYSMSRRRWSAVAWQFLNCFMGAHS